MTAKTITIVHILFVTYRQKFTCLLPPKILPCQENTCFHHNQSVFFSPLFDASKPLKSSTILSHITLPTSPSPIFCFGSKNASKCFNSFHTVYPLYTRISIYLNRVLESTLQVISIYVQLSYHLMLFLPLFYFTPSRNALCVQHSCPVPYFESPSSRISCLLSGMLQVKLTSRNLVLGNCIFTVHFPVL